MPEITADWATNPELRDCQVRLRDTRQRLEEAEAGLKAMAEELAEAKERAEAAEATITRLTSPEAVEAAAIELRCSTSPSDADPRSSDEITRTILEAALKVAKGEGGDGGE